MGIFKQVESLFLTRPFAPNSCPACPPAGFDQLLGNSFFWLGLNFLLLLPFFLMASSFLCDIRLCPFQGYALFKAFALFQGLDSWQGSPRKKMH